eukprot:6468162-Amphidinium_carterae.2
MACGRSTIGDLGQGLRIQDVDRCWPTTKRAKAAALHEWQSGPYSVLFLFHTEKLCTVEWIVDTWQMVMAIEPEELLDCEEEEEGSSRLARAVGCNPHFARRPPP